MGQWHSDIKLALGCRFVPPEKSMTQSDPGVCCFLTPE